MRVSPCDEASRALRAENETKTSVSRFPKTVIWWIWRQRKPPWYLVSLFSNYSTFISLAVFLGSMLFSDHCSRFLIKRNTSSFRLQTISIDGISVEHKISLSELLRFSPFNKLKMPWLQFTRAGCHIARHWSNVQQYLLECMGHKYIDCDVHKTWWFHVYRQGIEPHFDNII